MSLRLERRCDCFVLPDGVSTHLQEQEELFERAQGRFQQLASTAAGPESLQRARAAVLQLNNTAMLQELRQLAQEQPALRVLERLQGSGVQGVNADDGPVRSLLATA